MKAQAVLVGIALQLTTVVIMFIPFLLASDACCGVVIENVVAVLVLAIISTVGIALLALLLHWLILKMRKATSDLLALTFVSTIFGTFLYWIYWVTVLIQYLT